MKHILEYNIFNEELDTLKAPNGQKSNLTKKQWHQVRTEEFKNWFGDWENNQLNASKVLDENGEPLVVYHSTSSKFNTFDITKSRSYTGVLDYDLVGFYFTQRKEFASDYGDYIYSSYLNFKNPFTGSLGDYKRNNDLKTWRNVYDKLLGDGYDGAIENEGVNNSEEEYIAFIPNQIKSATDNNGDFNIENNNIYR